MEMQRKKREPDTYKEALSNWETERIDRMLEIHNILTAAGRDISEDEAEELMGLSEGKRAEIIHYWNSQPAADNPFSLDYEPDNFMHIVASLMELRIAVDVSEVQIYDTIMFLLQIRSEYYSAKLKAEAVMEHINKRMNPLANMNLKEEQPEKLKAASGTILERESQKKKQQKDVMFQ